MEKKLNAGAKPKEQNQSTLTEKQRFMNMVGQQVGFLREMRKSGKGEHFRVARQRIVDELSTYMWKSYCNMIYTYKEYRECLDYMRTELSWYSLLGVKQTSIFDLLTDEQLVDTMTE